jgi:hypothetical protein
VISSGPAGGNKEIVIFDPKQVPAGLFHWAEFACEAIRLEVDPAIEQMGGGGYYTCRKVKVAIETDFEYTFSLFGGDLGAAQAYVVTLVGAASQIYTNDINLKFELAFLRLWSTAADPWTAGDKVNQLLQFKFVWNQTMSGVDRHCAHFLSGRQLGGGAAFINTMCAQVNAYAISSDLTGFFPFPLQNNHPSNWDVFVFAHEIGHMINAVHTHEHCPPIDQCGPPPFGSCQTAQICTTAGTLMSQCDLCPGGTANIALTIDEPNRERMDSYLAMVNVGCPMLCVANDVCSGAPLIGAGVHPFSTVEANSQGPDEPAICGSGSPDIERDIWYKFLAPCTGTATVDLCDVNYDAKIAAYSSTCPASPDQAIACNDDACGFAPQMSFPVTSNTIYRLRIGGNHGAVGSGTMAITCATSPPCPADVTGDLHVNVADLLAAINSWGSCPAPPASCPADTNVDGQVNVTDLLTIINTWGDCP